MRAAVVTRYGAPDVLQVIQRPRPTPAPGEVLVRVRTSAVNSGDARMRALRVPEGMTLLMRLAVGWRGPRNPVLGADFAGEVVALGEGVTAHRVGDAVMGFTGMRMGAHAEYLCVPAASALPKPPALSRPKQWSSAAPSSGAQQPQTISGDLRSDLQGPNSVVLGPRELGGAYAKL